VEGSICVTLPNFMQICQNITEILRFSIFKIQASDILDFQTFGILMGDRVERVKVRHHAKFCGDRPSGRPATKSCSDFYLIWCVGRSRSDVCTSVTSTWSKVKVTQLQKFRKLHFSKSISSTILVWSSKLMVDYDNMGPSLHAPCRSQIF